MESKNLGQPPLSNPYVTERGDANGIPESAVLLRSPYIVQQIATKWVARLTGTSPQLSADAKRHMPVSEFATRICHAGKLAQRRKLMRPSMILLATERAPPICHGFQQSRSPGLLPDCSRFFWTVFSLA